MVLKDAVLKAISLEKITVMHHIYLHNGMSTGSLLLIVSEVILCFSVTFLFSTVNRGRSCYIRLCVICTTAIANHNRH